MLIDCDFLVSIERMKKYFIMRHNFVKNDEIELLNNPTIEYELHLINKDNGVEFDLIKQINGNDIDVTLNGNSYYIGRYSLYLDYFLNRKNLVNAGLMDFIQKTDKEILECGMSENNLLTLNLLCSKEKWN